MNQSPKNQETGEVERQSKAAEDFASSEKSDIQRETLSQQMLLNNRLAEQTEAEKKDADRVMRSGDFFTAEVLGDPLVITRAMDGQLRALSNVCRHRARPVASGPGNRKSLQCRYHGWTYGLDGKLLTQPEFEGAKDWDKNSICLPQYRVETWGMCYPLSTKPFRRLAASLEVTALCNAAIEAAREWFGTKPFDLPPSKTPEPSAVYLRQLSRFDELLDLQHSGFHRLNFLREHFFHRPHICCKVSNHPSGPASRPLFSPRSPRPIESLASFAPRILNPPHWLRRKLRMPSCFFKPRL